MDKKYLFKKYLDLDRWGSYWHQIAEILKCQPHSVLEIGVGDKTTMTYLKTNYPDINYCSLDLDESLKPDIVGSVEQMPFTNEAFDLICAFEVLEHLPFDKFVDILKEMRRVSKNKAIISLPHWGRHFSLDLRLPFFKRLRWQCKISIFPIPHVIGEHFWEIGKADYPLKKIKEKIKEAGWILERDFVAFESPYHHFFILTK